MEKLGATVFQKGISETLVLLSLYGHCFFEGRFSLKDKANSSKLTTYAETAPEEFLPILEDDLKSENPGVFDLFKPASRSPFITPSYLELSFALESLCWNKQRYIDP